MLTNKEVRLAETEACTLFRVLSQQISHETLT